MNITRKDIFVCEKTCLSGKRFRNYWLMRVRWFDAPGGVGGLRILETLTTNELHQCHPPSPLIFIESADWDFGTVWLSESCKTLIRRPRPGPCGRLRGYGLTCPQRFNSPGGGVAAGGSLRSSLSGSRPTSHSQGHGRPCLPHLRRDFLKQTGTSGRKMLKVILPLYHV